MIMDYAMKRLRNVLFSLIEKYHVKHFFFGKKGVLQSVGNGMKRRKIVLTLWKYVPSKWTK